MAYQFPYFPNYQNYPAYYSQQQAQQMPQQMPQQAQQNGFVRVQSENEARMYPVAPGHSVTFIDETGPFCYTKTMDVSQLDRPKFEKYRLVKEEDTPAQPVEYAEKNELAAIWDEINALKERFEKPKKSRKWEDEDE